MNINQKGLVMHIKGLLAAAGAAAVTSGAILGLSAAPASASVPPGWKCTSISSGATVGQLCITWDPSGYNVGYNKTGGEYQKAVDFNLDCASGRWFGDSGAFPIAASPNGTWRSYVFAVGSKGTCWPVLYDRVNGGAWAGPSITR